MPKPRDINPIIINRHEQKLASHHQKTKARQEADRQRKKTEQMRIASTNIMRENIPTDIAPSVLTQANVSDQRTTLLAKAEALARQLRFRETSARCLSIAAACSLMAAVCYWWANADFAATSIRSLEFGLFFALTLATALVFSFVCAIVFANGFLGAVVGSISVATCVGFAFTVTAVYASFSEGHDGLVDTIINDAAIAILIGTAGATIFAVFAAATVAYSFYVEPIAERHSVVMGQLKEIDEWSEN